MTNSEPLKVNDDYFAIVFWDWGNKRAYCKYYFIDAQDKTIVETDDKFKIKEMCFICREYCSTQGLEMYSY